MNNIQKFARQVRIDLIGMMSSSRSSHIGSCLSIVDILQILYYTVLNIDPKYPTKYDRDIFLLSKAHASGALYATLARRGFFPVDRLSEFYIDGGSLPGHLDRTLVPGVEASAGSLGHGLSIGVGMALARQNDNIDSRVYVLIGDGETDEGSVWEAATYAGNHELNNITVIIDNNRLQGLAVTSNHSDGLEKKFRAFGWDTEVVNGHNIDDLYGVLSVCNDRPRAIIANTIKGRGISFMENKLEWHYRSPDGDLADLAIKELGE